MLPKPLDLASLAGEPAYREAVRQAYDSLGNAWLTPSELLTPHYGRALAQWLLRDWQQHGGALRIVEVGPTAHQPTRCAPDPQPDPHTS